MYWNDFSLWKKYLTYAALKHCTRGYHALETAAHSFGCHPEDLAQDERFWSRYDLDEVEYSGYICFDEERGWLICDKTERDMRWWQEVNVGKEITIGYEKFLSQMRNRPGVVSKARFCMILSQEAVESEIAWSREKVEVGGTPPDLSLIVTEDLWPLVELTEDLWVKRALLQEFLWMNPAHAAVIRRFLTDPFFADSLISFLGFAASSRQEKSLSLDGYKLDDVIAEFNSNTDKMVCRDVEDYEIRHFLDIVGEYIGIDDNSVPNYFHGLQSFFVNWSLLNRCSIWNPGKPFLDAVVKAPERVTVFAEYLNWCTTYHEQEMMAWEILGRVGKRTRERYVQALVALVRYSEPFHPDLVGRILNYLFVEEPEELVFEKYTYLALMGSRNMGEKVKLFVLSLIPRKK